MENRKERGTEKTKGKGGRKTWKQKGKREGRKQGNQEEEERTWCNQVRKQVDVEEQIGREVRQDTGGEGGREAECWQEARRETAWKEGRSDIKNRMKGKLEQKEGKWTALEQAGDMEKWRIEKKKN